MLQTPRAARGMVVAPHHLAAQAGLAVLREGGNAVEAAVAVASTVPVVYPHMNSLGGDNFWLITEPGRRYRVQFAMAGNARPKKDLGMIAMAYGSVYVAHVAFGAADWLVVADERGRIWDLATPTLDGVWAGLTQSGSEIPRSGLHNATMAFLGTTTEPYGTVTPDASSRDWVRGRVSWFGGPGDTGVSSTETGAIK